MATEDCDTCSYDEDGELHLCTECLFPDTRD